MTPEVKEYLDNIREEQKPYFLKTREAILASLDPSFVEAIDYGMLGYAVPHSIYPSGYHCSPQKPLPFAGLAAQKQGIHLYHMGIYADKELYDWFVCSYSKVCTRKLDMGKSCIRFKKYEDIPYSLITELFQKMDSKAWISLYESAFKK
jgi:hypothetical protein